VKIDFDSSNIGRMKSKFLDYDNVERDGFSHESFADFSSGVVYVAGDYSEDYTLGLLVSAMSQMCFLRAFGNEGRPYERGDRESERALEAAIQEAERKRRRRSDDDLDWYIGIALEKETHLAREIYITSAFPWIIAFNGPIAGRSLLRTELPLLLDFYERRVLPALMEKARVSLN
jgi:hypothetical protein